MTARSISGVSPLLLRWLGILLVACASAGCGDGPSDDGAGSPVSDTRTALINGVSTSERPEVGVLRDPANFKCTATVIAPNWILTAAHCVSFTEDNPSGYRFTFGQVDSNSLGGLVRSGLKIVNLGPVGPPVDDPNMWYITHIVATTDHNGTNDIALILLAGGLPPGRVGQPSPVVPAKLATTMPADGDTVTQIGYGCTNWNLSRANDNIRRYGSWTLTHATGDLGRGPVVDQDGVIGMAASRPNPGYMNGGQTCPGDSGGPVFVGELGAHGDLWGVSSQGSGPFGVDTFGAAGFLHTICRSIYAAEAHRWCATGEALSVPPVGCAGLQSPADVQMQTDAVIRAVCARDPSCCDNVSGSWDGTCVNEASVAVPGAICPLHTDDIRRRRSEVFRWPLVDSGPRAHPGRPASPDTVTNPAGFVESRWAKPAAPPGFQPPETLQGRRLPEE